MISDKASLHSPLSYDGGSLAAVDHSRSLFEQAEARVAERNTKEQQQECIFSEFQAYRRWKEELAAARAPMNLSWDHTLGLATTASTASVRHVISEIPLNSAIDVEEEKALESLELGKFCGFIDVTD